MNKEQAMCKVNEHITELFEQLVYQDKISDGFDGWIVDNFKQCAINYLFDEYSYGKTSPKRELKWDFVQYDIKCGLNGRMSDEWRATALLLTKSDIAEKIKREHLCTQKWQYRDEFIHMFLELFKDIKSDIDMFVTLDIFRGDPAKRDKYFTDL